MEFIFRKRLSETDVRHRLAIPSEKLYMIAPLSLGENESIAVIDGTGYQWSFSLSTRNEGIYKKPVISGDGWRDFVKQKLLCEGDYITFHRETIENNEVRFRIGVELIGDRFKLFGAIVHP